MFVLAEMCQESQLNLAVIGAEEQASFVRYDCLTNQFAALAADTDRDAEIFKVQDQGVLKGSRWIRDIADVFKPGFKRYQFIKEYCDANPDMDIDMLDSVLADLLRIADREFGQIELNPSLDIDLVTDIFIRINSKGTVLSQGDFVMSKIAADEEHGGNQLRKLIDYFSHISVLPFFFICHVKGNTGWVLFGDKRSPAAYGRLRRSGE